MPGGVACLVLESGTVAPTVRAGAFSHGVLAERGQNSVSLWLSKVGVPLEAVGSFTGWFSWLVCVCCGQIDG